MINKKNLYLLLLEHVCCVLVYPSLPQILFGDDIPACTGEVGWATLKDDT